MKFMQLGDDVVTCASSESLVTNKTKGIKYKSALLSMTSSYVRVRNSARYLEAVRQAFLREEGRQAFGTTW
jgi:hypothetical protein